MRRNDIQDALAAWQGSPMEEARLEELLARLREDDAFRKELAKTLWALSMVQVVQAPEPRWLGLYEELGLLDEKEAVAEDAEEQKLLSQIWREPYRQQVSWKWHAIAMVSLGLAAAWMVFLFILRDGDVAPTDERKLAVVLGESKAVWGKDPLMAGGNWLRPGFHRLLSGSETLVFTDGIRVRLQAPVDFSLLNANAISCRRGALRVRLPRGAGNFRVDVPFGSVTDIGTDFAVSVSPDNGTKVAVFEGEVEVAIQQRGNDGIRVFTMTQGEATRVEADGSIQPSDATDLPPPLDMTMPPLILPAAYADRILADQPRHYWRMNRMEDGVIPDETGNGNSLIPLGSVNISADAGGRSSAQLSGVGGLVSQKPWRFGREGAALELWFVSEGGERTALAALAAGKPDGQHIVLLGYNDYLPERNANANADDYPPNRLRLLSRWPVSHRGGVNLFSTPMIEPHAWHHVVIQFKGQRMELHADGLPVKNAIADDLPKSVDAFLTLGLTYTLNHEQIGARPERFLNGRMAEVAVYDRALSKEEIRERYQKLKAIPMIPKAPLKGKE